MTFENRAEAGRELAWSLRKYLHRQDVIVLGAPRGGVPVAFEVALALGLPLDILVLRKLGVPGHEELAFGAIAGNDVRVLDPDIIEAALTDLDIERVTAAERRELDRRERLYRSGKPALRVQGQTVILIDDGMATGSIIRAAVRALRRMKPAAIVLAVPVAPRSTCDSLRREVDDLICLEMPEPFYGVGQFYVDFSQVSDREVIELLDLAWNRGSQPARSDANPSREQVHEAHRHRN